MIRLVKAITENIIDLKKYVDKSNDVTTYFQTRINKDLIYLSGGNYYDLFPSADLQVKNIELVSKTRGMVSLSDKQKQIMLEKHNKSYRYVLSFIDDLK